MTKLLTGPLRGGRVAAHPKREPLWSADELAMHLGVPKATFNWWMKQPGAPEPHALCPNLAGGCARHKRLWRPADVLRWWPNRREARDGP